MSVVIPGAVSRRALKCALFASSSSLALAVAAGEEARADNVRGCASDYNYTCSIAEGSGLTGIYQNIDVTVNGYIATIENDADTAATSGSQPVVIHYYAQGANGGAGGRGFDGGEYTVDNKGSLALVAGGSGGVGLIALVDIQARGGDGGDAGSESQNGGRAGDGGSLNIYNTGQMRIEAGATGSSSDAIYGIRSLIEGGDGGDMETGGAGDQKGGNGGDAKRILIRNESGASIEMGSSDGRIAMPNGVQAIKAYAAGGDGGSENGEGGAGGTIDIANDGVIDMWLDADGQRADPERSIAGIYAESLGGSGQSSSDNSDAGGKGEPGRPIVISNSGRISIDAIGIEEEFDPDETSAAIFALSRGGDGGASPSKNTGGAGGGAAQASGNYSPPYSSVVSVDTSGTISTRGDGIMGVVIRTRGGDGGAGNGSDDSRGGAAGAGGESQVSVTGGAISTDGNNAYAIVTQSIGGIGGGNANVAGAGGAGGAVGMYGDASASITTTGDFSSAVTLHSVGGGGGFGDDFTGVLYGSGGDGGNGGGGGQAEITSGARISTGGAHSYGLAVQSIGGGGGAGGVGAGLVLGLGGDGGEGGLGGDALINNSGAVTTAGYGSTGLLAQSISGGGGAAGVAGGVLSVGGQGGSSTGADSGKPSGIANINTAADVTTTGDAAVAVMAQSIGGGGGSGAGAAGLAAVGGSGGAASNGGVASIFAVSGAISTEGEFSHGLSAQSIGGGGGSGGDAIDLGVGVSAGIGGTGGSAGSGGTVCVTTAYDGCDTTGAVDYTQAPADAGATSIATRGDYAYGILAQSIGGGGGSGGSAAGAGALEVESLQVGGGGGAAGDGSGVEVILIDATLTTWGQNAPGMLAQSIGGGGGSGGSSVLAGAQDLVPVAIGGAGNSGGKASEVAVDLYGASVRTYGANSAGLVAQAIGGGGGHGGAASSYEGGVGFTFGVAVGGGGAEGGNAYTTSAGSSTRIYLTLNDDSQVATGFNADGTPNYDATDSSGIIAQSIGGGGGTGGASTTDAATVALPDFEGESFAVAASTAVGGVGGAGGHGGEVAMVLADTATVATGGDGSHGILAQSIGGGGGSGGSAQAMNVTLGDADSVEATVTAAIGGSGTTGGNGGLVSLTLQDQASVITWGANANGIMAQSVGGGGGDGGVGNLANRQLGGGLSATADIDLGGTGADGATGGTVELTIDRDASVTTWGPGSRAVLMQSIGGGGGTSQGGAVSVGGTYKTSDPDAPSYTGKVTVGVGVSGGDGGVGGAVTLTSSGTIATAGEDADGVMAQSIGGGGGLGGSTANDPGRKFDPFSEAEDDEEDGEGGDETYELQLSVGGKGGTGGDAGAVTTRLAGTVATLDDWSDGVVAQAIGGGGGAGGTAKAEGGDATANITVGVGGRGGAAGDGGVVAFEVGAGGLDTLSLSTGGYGAHGVVLQSIGGGGGQGGDGSDKAAGEITLGAGAGGGGGASGDGKSVTFTDSADGGITLSTAGDDAYGILAQSIGGGGGIAGAGSSEAADDDDSHQLQVSVGGAGGSSGAGGAVTVGLQRNSSIATLGDRAFGIVAQSIGGGGGVGGASHSGSLLSVSVGGRGGSSGDGAAVSVTLASGSQISTAGDGAHGVVAQSIGGGGGIGGDASGPNYSFRGIKGSDSATGEGHDVTVTAEGTIRTTGTRAHGIVAQSVSGGGGIVGDRTGISYGANTSQGGTAQTSGKVTIGQAGTIATTGFESIGILAQSSAGARPGEVDISIDGDVTGGTGSNGAGVMILQSGPSAVYVNQGAVVSAGDADAWSVRARVDENGFVDVYNYGTLNGDVSLQSTEGVGGHVQNDGTWTGVDRSAADVTNAGTVDLVAEPGAMTAAGRSVGPAPVPPAPDRAGIDDARIRGDFAQTRDGTLRVTGDFDRKRMDLLRVDGTARLGGRLLIEPVTISPDARVQVITAEGGLRGRFDEIESVLFEFAQRRSGGEIAIEAVDSDFAAPELGLDAQQAAAGRYLDGIFDAGGEGFGAFFAGQERLARLDPAAYAQSLSIFAPGATLAPAAANFDRARSRLDAAQGCDGPAAVGGGGAAMDGAGRCLRMLGGIERRDQQGDASGAFGYDGSVWTTGVAGQAVVAPGWILGGALGYEGADYAGDTSTSAEGGTGFLALSARHEIGAWGLSAGLGGSWGAFDLERRLAGATATAETEVWSLAGRVRADWTMALPHGWFRPSLDVDVVHSAAGGYSERGAGALNLALAASEETAVMATPALELGGETPLTPGSMLRGWVRVGATLSSLDGYGAQGRLASAGPALGGFANTVAVPDATARLSAGLAVVEAERLSVEAVYDGAFADCYSAHGGSLRLTLRF